MNRNSGFRIAILMIVIFVTKYVSLAQVPYFANTVGDHRLYGYTSIKYSIDRGDVESYSTAQYGFGEYFATGMDVSTSEGNTTYGFIARFGKTISPYFNVGLQVTPSLSLARKIKFSHLTSAIYMNGQLSNDGNLFWVTNTWITVNNHISPDYSQWLYLGYKLGISESKSLTFMGGYIFSWKMNRKGDIPIGVYYSFGRFNLYLWCDKLLNQDCRLVGGIDIAI